MKFISLILLINGECSIAPPRPVAGHVRGGKEPWRFYAVYAVVGIKTSTSTYEMFDDFAQRQTAFRSSGISNPVVDLWSKVNKMFFCFIVVLQPLF